MSLRRPRPRFRRQRLVERSERAGESASCVQNSWKEVMNMNRLSTLLIALALPVAFAAPSAAEKGKTLGTVINGNTTTEFKAADTSDIDTQKLNTWNDFANRHPKIARELGASQS